MNAIYIMLAVGFGYWIGNSKSPQIVYDESKCPVVLESKQAVETPQSNTLTKQVQSTIVEPINQSSPTPTPSTKNDTKQDEELKSVDAEADKKAWIKDQIDGISKYLVEYEVGTTRIYFKQDNIAYLPDLKIKIDDNHFHIANEGEVNQGGYVYMIEVGK